MKCARRRWRSVGTTALLLMLVASCEPAWDGPTLLAAADAAGGTGSADGAVLPPVPDDAQAPLLPDLADDTGPAADIDRPPADVPSPEDVQEDDLYIPPAVRPCAACLLESDCGPFMTCAQLGPERNCIAPCALDGDCPSGWRCDAFDSKGSFCVPLAYECSAGCLEEGCPEGLTCDQKRGSSTHGWCVPAAEQCAGCIEDWECGEGLRCALTGAGNQFCVPTCESEGACPDWAHCDERGGVGGAGVYVCVPDNGSCCGPDCRPDECSPACGGLLPICHNGRCVACVTDTDCPQPGEFCDRATYTCAGPCSGTPTTPYLLDEVCVQCLDDSHCADGDLCNSETHTCGTGDPCGNACAEPYPACAVVNGVPTCVPCTEDAHCGTGTCDRATFSCTCASGTTCAEDCAQDCAVNGCPDDDRFHLRCDPNSGCCYDERGFCDNVTAFCHEASGSTCISVFDIFSGGHLPGGQPDWLPTEGLFTIFTGGLCSCDAGAAALCELLPSLPICDEKPACYDDPSCLPIGSLIRLFTDDDPGGSPLLSGDFCTYVGL